MSDAPATRRPRTRSDGWTPARQARFTDALAAGASVVEACAIVGLSRESAYRLRRHAGGGAFRRAWDAALDGERASAFTTAFDRAINGVEKPVFHKGRQTASYRAFDDRLLIAMVRSDEGIMAALDGGKRGANVRRVSTFAA